jgi:WD40 repeat protein
MYDGSTGEKIKEIGDESTAHQGGVFSFSWSPKSDKIFTTSADYTCKLWDIESGKVVQ